MSEGGEEIPLFQGRRVVVCVGSGGVGKTTVAAAVALRAAEAGLRTLCLTIDPARRLAGAFGMESFPREEVEVSSDWLQDQGVELKAGLTVMMLDAKKTFDDLIIAHCPTQQSASAILNNRVYAQVSTRLAGVRSYMAMEKVQQELAAGEFDLIVLDTPPSSRALDFFDAPEKMVDILDSPATRALVRAMGGSGRLSVDVLAFGLKRALSAFDKIVGSSLLQEMAELLSQMNVMFGGFEHRAKEVGRRMRGKEFAYLLVTSPSAPALLDAAALQQEMAGRHLTISELVVNRVTPAPADEVSVDELLASAEFQRLDLPPELATGICQAARDARLERAAELERVAELSSHFGGEAILLASSPVALHRPKSLLALGEAITKGSHPR